MRRKIVRAVSLKAKPSNILTRQSPFSCRSQPPLILDLFENVTLAPHRPSRASTISQTDFPTLIVTRARDLLFSLPFQPLARPNREESEREGKIILRLTDLSAACDAFKFSCNVPLQIFQICLCVILNSEMSIQLRFRVCRRVGCLDTRQLFNDTPLLQHHECTWCNALAYIPTINSS